VISSLQALEIISKVELEECWDEMTGGEVNGNY